MFKKQFAILGLTISGVVFSAYWLWAGFVNTLQEDTINIPQRTIKSVEIVESQTVEEPYPSVVEQYNELEKKVTKVWGEDEVVLPSPKEFVKYTQDYEARAQVNFENGAVVIETVSPYPTRSLKDAIVSMALAPASPAVDQFSAKDIILNGNPALYGQLLNKDGQPMRYGARANEYAEELIKESLEKREIVVNGRIKTVYRVNAELAKSSLWQRAKQYEDIIAGAANKFGLGERLLYAIAHTESYFNPFAVSSASAYGLMQIVPSSAGAEVHELLTGKKGRPSREFLFNPKNNVEYGAAYIHLLARRYFDGVTDPASRELCIIAAYNGGPNAVFKTFGKNKESATKRINSMTHQEVYRHLIKNLPSRETRFYVDKVLASLGTFTAANDSSH